MNFQHSLARITAVYTRSHAHDLRPDRPEVTEIDWYDPAKERSAESERGNLKAAKESRVNRDHLRGKYGGVRSATGRQGRVGNFEDQPIMQTTQTIGVKEEA
jgi:hypothetical protein